MKISLKTSQNSKEDFWLMTQMGNEISQIEQELIDYLNRAKYLAGYFYLSASSNLCSSRFHLCHLTSHLCHQPKI